MLCIPIMLWTMGLCAPSPLNMARSLQLLLSRHSQLFMLCTQKDLPYQCETASSTLHNYISLFYKHTLYCDMNNLCIAHHQYVVMVVYICTYVRIQLIMLKSICICYTHTHIPSYFLCTMHQATEAVEMPKIVDHDETKEFAKLPLVTKLKKLSSNLTTIEVTILHTQLTSYLVVNFFMSVHQLHCKYQQ